MFVVLGDDAFLKEKPEKAPANDWQLLFVQNYDEAMRVMRYTPISSFIVGPYTKGKNGATRIAQVCQQTETIPFVLYSDSSLHFDWLKDAKLSEKTTACSAIRLRTRHAKFLR